MTGDQMERLIQILQRLHEDLYVISVALKKLSEVK